MTARLAGAAAILATGVSLMSPGPSAAQGTGSTTVSFAVSGGGTPIAQFSVPVHFEGQLAVTFRGDPATGCAAAGTCGYSGTVYWRPPSEGSLEIDEFRQHGRTSVAGHLVFGGDSSQSAITTARQLALCRRLATFIGLQRRAHRAGAALAVPRHEHRRHSLRLRCPYNTLRRPENR
jgi:hypothetical protein